MTRTARWSFFLVPRKFGRACAKDFRGLYRVGFILQLSLIIGLALSTASRAVEPDEIMADSRLEARARALSVGLRCLVCQNQSIDDSNAPLARDLRQLVRERLKSGESDAEVMRFITDRYGQFVLLNPPVGRNTALLWATPLLLLAAGGAFWWRRRPAARSAPAAPASLSADEKRRLAKLLAKSE
jgi:cytochrome c-type biogenesis protein CcmH